MRIFCWYGPAKRHTHTYTYIHIHMCIYTPMYEDLHVGWHRGQHQAPHCRPWTRDVILTHSDKSWSSRSPCLMHTGTSLKYTSWTALGDPPTLSRSLGEGRCEGGATLQSQTHTQRQREAQAPPGDRATHRVTTLLLLLPLRYSSSRPPPLPKLYSFPRP